MSLAPELFGVALNSKDTLVAQVRKLNHLSFGPPGLADPAAFLKRDGGTIIHMFLASALRADSWPLSNQPKNSWRSYGNQQSRTDEGDEDEGGSGL
jgi:hypothetical protein